MNEIEKKTGAELLYNALVSEGVEVLFGYPGSDMLPFYDKLYDSKQIRHVLVRHEQAAAHAADGYARVSGKVGLCMATSGPGATNLITGIAAAMADSIPIVAITFNAPSSLEGKGAFQEADILSMTKPITKSSYHVECVEDIPVIIKHAFKQCRSFPHGPVLIDIPSDMMRCTAKGRSSIAFPPLEPLKELLTHDELNSFFSHLFDARQPVCIAGSGVIQSGVHKQFIRFIEKTGIPAATTVSGIGSISEDHPLALETIGVLGTPYANSALQKADLIIAWGMHFEPRSTARAKSFAPNAHIIQIDINHRTCALFVQPTVCLNGDISMVLTQVLEDERLGQFHTSQSWQGHIALWKESCAFPKMSPDRLHPQQIMEALESLAPHIRVFSGNGLHKYWALRHFHYCYPHQFNTNSRFGAMGFALPGSLGAAIALRGEPIALIVGDGDIQMTIQELATIVQERLPIKILVFNNGSLGAIRQHQHHSYGKRYIASTFEQELPIDAIARAYGIEAVNLSSQKDIVSVLRKALDVPGPFLINCRIDPDLYLDKKISIHQSLDDLTCPVEPIDKSI